MSELTSISCFAPEAKDFRYYARTIIYNIYNLCLRLSQLYSAGKALSIDVIQTKVDRLRQQAESLLQSTLSTHGSEERCKSIEQGLLLVTTSVDSDLFHFVSSDIANHEDFPALIENR